MNKSISQMKMKLFEEVEEGNAFTRALAKTKKGGEFKIGGKTVKDTSNYDNASVKEMLCKECGSGYMEDGKCNECGYMQESTLYPKHYMIPDPDNTDQSETYSGDNVSLASSIMGGDDSAGDNAADSGDGGMEEGMDHEVAMAKASLQSIVSSASQLMNKIGDEERNLPGWIQDHITNAENYIDQANQGFHELDGAAELPDTDAAPDEESGLTSLQEISLEKVAAADSAITNLISNISTHANIATAEKEGLLNALKELQSFIDEVGYETEVEDEEDYVSDYSKRRAQEKDMEESSLTAMMESILREAEKGPFFVKVAVRDAKKAHDIINDSPLYRKSVNMGGSNVFYFGEESTAYDFMMDCGVNDVEVISDNVHERHDDKINEKKKPSAGLDKTGYTKNAQAPGPYRGGIGMGAGLEEKKKPSAGLTKKQKSTIVKKAIKGKDIGKKGKGFADVEKAAKAGGAKDPKAVAAAAMWKSAAKKAGK